MKKIYLTQNKYTIVDDADYDLVMELGGWYAFYQPRRNCFCFVVKTNAYDIHGKRVTIYMHRLLMNFPVNKEIDHIDNNPLNNQRANLRLATNAQNAMNSRKRKMHGRKPSSIYKGVSWYKQGKKWRACIMFNGKNIHLGYFKREEDAGLVYNKKAIQLFGKYALLNNIGGNQNV